MNISTPTALGFYQTSSNSTHPSSSEAINSKDAPAVIESTANDLSLWRTILNIHGKEILECATNQFLDLAMVLRLETISARDLVHLLAKAGRLGYRETDVIEDDAGDPLVHEVHEGS